MLLFALLFVLLFVGAAGQEGGGGISPELEQVVQAWTEAGFQAKATADIMARIWEKLLCNCAYSASCALTGLTVGQVQDCPEVWAVAVGCAREAFQVSEKGEVLLRGVGTLRCF